MKKTVTLLLCLALSLAAPAAFAANARLTDYSLLLSGKEIALSESTGYIGRSGKRVTLPFARFLQAADISFEENDAKTRLTANTPSGAKLELAVGYKAARVDGKKRGLKVKTYKMDGALMADISCVVPFGFQYKLLKPSEATRAAGFKGGVVLVGKAGENLALPESGGSGSQESFVSSLPAAKLTDQIVYVKYKSGSSATLSFHEKGADGLWKQTLSAAAYVGKNGIGKTREGDGRTPSGTFNLSPAFGIKANPGTALPYTKVTKYHFWCGSSGSKYYNQLIDTRETDLKRTSADEYLISFGSVYNYCAFIDYNAAGEAGKGSCIFLHCAGKSASTTGCVAIPEKKMVSLLKALKPGAKIVIE